MTNELQVFNFNNIPLRTTVIDNEPWFCLADICNVLEIKQRADLRKRLNPRGMGLIPTPCGKGGKQKTYYVNEPNLYRTILKSDKPEAQKFEDWICDEVLPSIRKTGSYSLAPQVDMKAIGGMVKKCCAVAVRDELAAVLTGDPQAQWELTTEQLIYDLQRWHYTQNRKDTERFRELVGRCDLLMAENADLKNRMEKISSWVK